MHKWLIDVSNPVFDEILPKLRPAFAPIYYLGRVAGWTVYLIRILSNEYLKGRIGQCGKNVRLNGRMRFHGLKGLKLGNNVHINDNAFLRAEGGISIADNCHISRNVVIYSINHRYEGNALPYDEKVLKKPVHIEENVWIGINVTIAPGVTIGEGAVIGMGAVLREDVEPMAVIGSGVNRVLKYRNEERYRHLREAKLFSGPSGVPR